MATANISGDITQRTSCFAKVKLLSAGQFRLILERFGQRDPMPKNKGLIVKWRRYLNLPRAVAPLAEGIAPAGQAMTYEDVTATLEQFGDAVKLTDVIADTHEDPVLKVYMDLCGTQAAETVEVVRFSTLKAGSNVYYAPASATTRAAVNSPALRGGFRLILRSFRKNKASEISEIIKASARVSTEPVAPAFFALGHTDLDSDIRGITGFTSVEQYSDSDKGLPLEIGKIESTRIILSPLFEPWLAAGTSGSTYLTNGGTGTGACDVYPILVFGKDAYGIVPLQGEDAVTPMVLNPGKPSASDPLGQIGWVSWKTMQAAAILNQLWMARYEVGATQTPV